MYSCSQQCCLYVFIVPAATMTARDGTLLTPPPPTHTHTHTHTPPMVFPPGYCYPHPTPLSCNATSSVDLLQPERVQISGLYVPLSQTDWTNPSRLTLKPSCNGLQTLCSVDRVSYDGPQTRTQRGTLNLLRHDRTCMLCEHVRTCMQYDTTSETLEEYCFKIIVF